MGAPKRSMPRPAGDVKDAVEQAIARGWRPDQICLELGVPAARVGAIWRAMQAAVDDQPSRPRPCGTHAAYERHRARGEAPCSRCKRAESARGSGQQRQAGAA